MKAKWKKITDFPIETQLWFYRSMMVAFDPKRKVKEVHIEKDYDHNKSSKLVIYRDEQGFEYGEMTGVRFIAPKGWKKK